MSRINSIPRRDWRALAPAVRDLLTDVLKTPSGAQKLRDVQAVTIAEAVEYGGVFCQADLGAGKTLPSFLIATALGAKRPVLLIQANAVSQSKSDFAEYSQHWECSKRLRRRTYSWLGHPSHEDWLLQFRPDVIIADEADSLRNFRKSAVARRTHRYVRACRDPKFAARLGVVGDLPNVKVFAFSATWAKDSVDDYAHILWWCLGDRAPVPPPGSVLRAWVNIIDPNERCGVRVSNCEYAALSAAFGEKVTTKTEARAAFYRRLSDTPGVILMTEVFREQPLYLHEHRCDVPDAVVPHLERLETKWEAPDGWRFADSKFEVWAALRQLANGFCQIHDPRPPADWFEARRCWGQRCREIIEQTHYDSACLIEAAHGAGQMVSTEYEDWVAIRDKYHPELHVLPLWFTNEVLESVAAWAERQKDAPLIWVEHREVGRKLRELTGWRHYDAEATDARTGQHVKDSHPRNGPAIVAYKACRRAQNLQAWNNNYIMQPHSDAPNQDQMLGRTHRSGQQRPVHATFRFSIPTHRESLRQALRLAEANRESLGRESRLLIGEWQ